MFSKRYYERGRHARLFEKGDLKYVILDLLKEKPSHGYEIIRALEDRFHGFYVPSAGSVYPTLQLLEDMGYVTSAEQDGKRVYTITEEGKKFISERRDTMDRIKGHMKDWWSPETHEEIREIMHEIGRLVHNIGRKVRRMDHEKLNRVREIVARAEREVEEIK
ncbi:MAG: PadR family transcriptional regulator [Dehalococcoidia bacterium]|nr:PadR family transcriptional regulator [Dehalococcoidia bacterium]